MISILQFIEDAVADYDEFEQGQPVSIQVDPWNLPIGIKLDFTPGNVDLTIPSGQMFAIPLFKQPLTLPTLGPITISADTNAIVIQKAGS